MGYIEDYQTTKTKEGFIELMLSRKTMKMESARRLWYRIDREMHKNMVPESIKNMRYAVDYQRVKGNKERFVEQLVRRYSIPRPTAKRRFYDLRSRIAQENGPKEKIIRLKPQERLQQHFEKEIIREVVKPSVKQNLWPEELTQKPNMMKMRDYEELKVLKGKPSREMMRTYGFTVKEMNWIENWEERQYANAN